MKSFIICSWIFVFSQGKPAKRARKDKDAVENEEDDFFEEEEEEPDLSSDNPEDEVWWW